MADAKLIEAMARRMAPLATGAEDVAYWRDCARAALSAAAEAGYVLVSPDEVCHAPESLIRKVLSVEHAQTLLAALESK